jgi:hypothetical protein
MRCSGRTANLGIVLAFASALVPCVLAAGQVPSVAARITPAVDESNRITLRGNTHPLARAEFDRGRAPESQPVNRILLLLRRSPEQESALRRLLDAQQTISSPNYHHWLTPAEFGEQFGPADTDIQAVGSWLVSHGFTVNRVSAGKTIIEFSGNVGQISQWRTADYGVLQC